MYVQSSVARDALAKALYCRTVATIVRRANSLKRLCMSGTLSSDSNDSVHNQAEVASQHASTVGTAGSKSSRSMAVLNTAVRHATDGFIGILDMFGFEDPKVFPPSKLSSSLLDFNDFLLDISMFSRVSWSICALTSAPKRCNTFSTLTSSSRASNRVVRKESSANWNPIMWITCLASTSSHLWYDCA